MIVWSVSSFCWAVHFERRRVNEGMSMHKFFRMAALAAAMSLPALTTLAAEAADLKIGFVNQERILRESVPAKRRMRSWFTKPILSSAASAASVVSGRSQDRLCKPGTHPARIGAGQALADQAGKGVRHAQGRARQDGKAGPRYRGHAAKRGGHVVRSRPCRQGTSVVAADARF